MSYHFSKSSRLRIASSTSLLCAGGLFVSPMALADESSDIANVQAQIQDLQQQLDKLKQAQKAAELAAQEQSKTASAYSRFTLSTSDGRNTLAFRSLVQADAAVYSQDGEGTLANDWRRGSVGGTPNRENNGARDLSSGIYFRRARFGFEGTMARDFGYKLILEIGGSGTETQGRISDAWISYTGLAPFTFQIGAFSPPANLDDSTSADDTLFLERSTPTEISRATAAADGRIAFSVKANGTRWMSALSFTSRTVADAEVYDAQTALVGRVAFLAATSNNYNWHLGAAGSYVLHPADQGIDATGTRRGIRFRDRPELRVDSTRLIDTGSIDAKHASVYGIETAGNYQSFYAQSEYYRYGIDRPDGAVARDPHFSGYYAQASWMMTGEAKRYSMANGAYQVARPFRPFNSGGGIGAFELATRYSHADFNFEEGALLTAPTVNSVRGGEQSIWTAGLNWYATANVKFMANVLWVNVDRLNPAGPGNTTPFGAAPATPPVGFEIGQSYRAYALRSQFNF